MSKELIPAPEVVPKIIDEEGNKIVGPEMEAVIGLVGQMAQLAQLARIRKSLEKEEFEGNVDHRDLAATDQLQWIDLIDRFPNTPWVSAFIINDGPNDALLAINNAYSWIRIKHRETRTVNYSKADRRIEIIYYQCDPGNTALVRVDGEY
jgi:hypothetical protein